MNQTYDDMELPVSYTYFVNVHIIWNVWNILKNPAQVSNPLNGARVIHEYVYDVQVVVILIIY